MLANCYVQSMCEFVLKCSLVSPCPSLANQVVRTIAAAGLDLAYYSLAEAASHLTSLAGRTLAPEAALMNMKGPTSALHACFLSTAIGHVVNLLVQ